MGVESKQGQVRGIEFETCMADGEGSRKWIQELHSGIELIGLESERNKGEGRAYDGLGF